MDVTMDREGAILQAAIDTFGAESQTDMMIEEMSELIKALLKARRSGKRPEDLSFCQLANILEEMADVYIMLNQMALIYGDPAEWEIYKLERLAERLGMCQTHEEGGGQGGTFMKTGEIIGALAAKKGINLRQLAIKSNVPYNTLYAIVRRKSSRIDGETLRKIAAALNISFEQMQLEHLPTDG